MSTTPTPPNPESEVMPDTGRPPEPTDATQPRSVSRAGLVERLDYARRRFDAVLYTDLIALLSDAAAALEASPAFTDAQIERAVVAMDKFIRIAGDQYEAVQAVIAALFPAEGGDNAE